MSSPACRPCLSTKDRLVTIAPVDIPRSSATAEEQNTLRDHRTG
jgi:hypothetical protein